VPQAT